MKAHTNKNNQRGSPIWSHVDFFFDESLLSQNRLVAILGVQQLVCLAFARFSQKIAIKALNHRIVMTLAQPLAHILAVDEGVS